LRFVHVEAGQAPIDQAVGDADQWLLALAMVGDDMSAHGLARFGEVGLAEAERVLASARRDGVVSSDGLVDQVERARLVASLPHGVRADVHVKAARMLLAEGPSGLQAAAQHLRTAASLSDPESALQLADSHARLCLSLSDYASAATLLALAAEYDTSTDVSSQGHRLCDLASAIEALGDLEGARVRLAQAVTLGELAGDAALVARAAVAHTLPVDWHAGNPRTTGLLQRAAAMELVHDDRVAVLAAQALAEMRIPVLVDEFDQVAWVTRPAVAQPLAQQALDHSASCDPWVRCLALLAWRSTHRAPALLDRRCEASAGALALAAGLRNPSFHVEAAVWRAVDALESGDRDGFDDALSIARWVAHDDGNPRLQFRALTLAMGAALLDGDHDEAAVLLGRTIAVVEPMDSSLAAVITTVFGGQMVVDGDDPTVMAGLGLEPSSPFVIHPMGRAATAYVWARTGRHDVAAAHARRALRQLDHESSSLLTATRVAAVACELGDRDLAREVLGVLTPFADHVAVDGNGWWCDGPVSLWLAGLHRTLGQPELAKAKLEAAHDMVRTVHDARGMRRVEALRAQLPAQGRIHVQVERLSPREHAVLTRLATGATNARIAGELSFSLSTIRNDTMAIYRKLGVTGRPEAVARAVALGLLAPRSVASVSEA